MNRDLCYRGLGYAAWGYLFLHININLGNMDLLPEWAGYLLLLSAIGLLKAERRDLALLSPLGGLLALAGLTVCIVIMVQLFALRRAFSPEEGEEPLS